MKGQQALTVSGKGSLSQKHSFSQTGGKEEEEPENEEGGVKVKRLPWDGLEHLRATGCWGHLER